MSESQEPTVTEPVRESVLAQRLNVPRAQFKLWREDGISLLSPEHWVKDDTGAYVMTAEGQARVLELMHVPPDQQPPPLVKVQLRAVCAGVMARVLRCRPVDGGPMVSVRLTGSNVFASKFRKGDCVEAMPTELEGIYEYDGPAPRRSKL